MSEMHGITRRFEIDAGHRVLGHKGKCRHFHGHRYAIEVSIISVGLNNMGMVVDFGDVKEEIGKWLDYNLDHNMILNQEDPILNKLAFEEDDFFDIHGKQPFVMTNNPTAENIAELLYRVFTSIVSKWNLGLSRVRVYETPNC